MNDWEAGEIVLSSGPLPAWDADEIVLTPLWDGDGVLFKYNENHDELGRFAETGTTGSTSTESSGLAPTISTAQEQTVERYTGVNSSAINQQLRYGTKPADKVGTAKDIATLDQLLDQNRTTTDTVVHRSITRDMAKALDKAIAKNQGAFVDKGFVSTTRKQRFAELRGEAYVSIEIPKGSAALDVKPWSKKPEEDETLIARGQTFVARRDPAASNHFFVRLASTTSKAHLLPMAKRVVRGKYADNKFVWDEGDVVFLTAKYDVGKDYNPDQPRDEQGRWTALGGSVGHYALISTAPITALGVGAAGRAAMANARTQYTRIDMAQLDKDPATKAAMVQLFRDPELFPMIRANEWTGNTDQDARLIIDRMKSNLTAMWNDIPDAQRQEWRSWYDGAHNLIGNRMEEYKDFNIDRASMTGVYAALSPNTMWDVNVHLGDRLLDTYFHHSDDMWDAGMQKAADEQIARAERGIAAKEEKTGVEATQARRNLEIIKQQYADLTDKTLNQLDGDSAKEAAWIKLYNDAHDNTGVREVKINGEMGEPIRNKAKLGEEGEVLSGSFGVANRAIAALDALKSHGDANKLSEAVGDRHKVRSFYNNILDPNSPNDDVTIDTHAGGAAWMMPLGGKDTQIGQMLGSSVGAGKPGAPTSRVTGIKGTYPFYADAYREVAREVGLAHPRELQSIEWEKKIELFRNFPDAKRVQVDEAWKMFYDGTISLEQAQSNVLRIAKEGSRK